MLARCFATLTGNVEPRMMQVGVTLLLVLLLLGLTPWQEVRGAREAIDMSR
jgi:hypothetical protein